MAASHLRSDSTASKATIASNSSISSLGSYEDLQTAIEDLLVIVKEDQIPKFQEKAQNLITRLSTENSFNEIKYAGSSLRLDNILKAMLQHAVGLDGKKYVLAAILSCESSAEGDESAERYQDSLKKLKAVAETWLYYVLFIFKAGPEGHKNQTYANPASMVTPTIEITQIDLTGLKGNRSLPRDNLLKRDGFQCVVTGMLDIDNPHGRPGLRGALQGAHILRRAVACFREGTAASRAAAVTFDILRHFSALPEAVIRDLENCADHVSNAITLDLQAHSNWDRYRFCLKPTDVEHEYTILYYSDDAKRLMEIYRNANDIPCDAPVRFKDRSDEFQGAKLDHDGGDDDDDDDDDDGNGNNNNKKKRETRHGSKSQPPVKFELPNPTFIALHAAVAGVLNMSGAGKFFDELLSKFGEDDKTNPPIRCWDDLEERVNKDSLANRVCETVLSA